MELFESFAKINGPVALTIGVFDGVHLGHQTLLKTLRSQGAKSLVITFKNHPKAFIQKTSTRYIHPLNQRIELLKEEKVDDVVALEFSEELRNLTAKEFINKCCASFNVKILVLGHDTAIGSDRLSDLKAICKIFPHVIQVPPFLIDGVVISSQKIRDCIQKGDFKTASKWLGRAYEWKIDSNLDVSDLALPPAGVWDVRVDEKPAQVEIDKDRRLKILNQNIDPKKMPLVPLFKIRWDLSHLP